MKNKNNKKLAIAGIILISILSFIFLISAFPQGMTPQGMTLVSPLVSLTPQEEIAQLENEFLKNGGIL